MHSDTDPNPPKAGAGLTDLEQHEVALAEVQLTDFRAANLFHLVSSFIPPGGSVLDVGCGASGLVAWLLEAGFDARGIDTSAPTITAARQFFERRGLDPTRIGVDNTRALVARGEQVETVTCMDCLEHVLDDRALFDQLVDLTAPGGRLIVTVPALMRLFGERDVRMGHYRRYERHQLAALAAHPALEVEVLRFWNVLGVAPTWISQTILRRGVDEGFRFGPPTLRKRLMRRALSTWFGQVENRLVPPIGMTLLLVARRR